MTVIQYFLAFLVLWFITIFLQYIFKRAGKKPAGYCPPPSPPTLPLIGHLHLLTPVAYKGFHALNNKYGPLLYLRLATYPAVLVSSAPVATEIFRAQDVHFASRIKSPFEDNLLFGSSTSFFNAPYGDYWKFMKKICMTELLGTSQMKKLKNVRREEVVRFLSKMLEIGQKNEVADLSAEVLTLANNSTCRMIMSARCSGEDNQADKCRALVSESFDLAAKLAVCNLFGPLKRIGIWFLRKKIADVPRRYDELFENVMVEHEEKAKREGPHMENKDLMDILLEVYHDKNAEMRITRKQMKTFFLDLFTGGTSTTADAILWILGELVNHPAAFKKLREEIDSVVGTERLVDEADIPNLPYFQACVKEAMRLHPPVPLFDRVCREDCKLAGYDIPKGITMIMNAYSIMRDPKIWDNPNDFIPERFLTEQDNTKGQNLQVYVPFGGGRRMCPGTNMSSSLINGSVTAMVQCFDWKVVGGDGPDGSKVNMDTKAGVTMSLDKSFMSNPVLHRNLFSIKFFAQEANSRPVLFPLLYKIMFRSFTESILLLNNGEIKQKRHKMLGIGLVLVALFVIYYTHLLIKWKYPKINGVRVQLPPGSMGLPIIGETIQLLIPSHNSIDIHPFVRKRIQRYGPIFRTNLVGRPIIVSADPEVNKYIFSQEGNLVEMWYLDSFAKLFAFEGESKVTAIGRVHRYLRGITLNHFGGESLREKMLPQIEVAINNNLCRWSTQGPVEVKSAISRMIFNFTAKVAFGYDVENSKGEKIENLPNFIKSLMSFPLNIPGTTFHKCMKDKEKMSSMVRHIIKERFNSPDKRPGDFLDQAINDMASEKFLTVDFIAELAFGILFAAFESVSTTLTLAIKFLAENPLVLEELTVENEAVLKKRENPDALLTWEEYKEMTFTQSVVNETLRLMNIPPGLLRKALKDINVKASYDLHLPGYTIPAGWTIMLVTPIVHLNPETYKDPLKFNPWRWKDLDQVTVSKSFMPFGGGTRQCAGAEFSKVYMAAFLHVLVTKYRYGPIFRTNLVGRPIIVSADPEVNKYIFSQEGNLVEMWYLDSFAKLFAFEGESKVTAIGRVHRYLRGITLNHFGGESLREKMLPQIEVAINNNLCRWSTQGPVEVKSAISRMIFNFTAKVAFGYDVENSKGRKLKTCPISSKDKEKMSSMVRHIIKERFNSPDKRPGDFLDQAINDMASEKFLTVDFIAELAFGILFAAFESVSTTLTLAIKFLAENPLVLEELTVENEAVLKKRENPDALLTWEEYKEMTFTQSVVNETLRLMNIPPGLLRKALKDINVKGYTIPAVGR
ncbi:hypothetical protein NC652_023209 [Populus alba x Populus x berolinensis]|nr:hypothetical protein NC652_023209 [Populus alba x Populus x berolinensis]